MPMTGFKSGEFGPQMRWDEL